MESKLKAVLNVSKLKSTGMSASGCVNEGTAYDTENGRIFVKKNFKEGARLMFDGEYASLNAILNTGTIKAPKPLAVVDIDAGGAAIAMEFINLSSLRKYSSSLGELLARMHLHNESQKNVASSVHNKSEYIDNFGFHVTTCCGYLPLDNSWNSDWVEFFAQQRIEKQIKLAESKYGDREAIELWSHLKVKIPSFFQGINVIPSLLHGDLWSGNAGETKDGPVIYDPATFYGHSEFELSIASMFGGFPSAFFTAYHNLIPKEPGFEIRSQLYQLFHYLNHWNHFGGGYRGQSLSIMRKLIRI